MSVYGHTAECPDDEGNYQHGVILYHYYSPRSLFPEKLAHVSARSQNLDGYAIQHAANLFAAGHRFAQRKIMFVISDGLPAGERYGGSPAWRHMKEVSDACLTQLEVEVYGVGISNAYDNRRGAAMYGEGNFVVLQDVRSSLGVMVRFLKQAALAMKKKD